MIKQHPTLKIEYHLVGDGTSSAIELLKQAQHVGVHDKWNSFVIAINGRYCNANVKECWYFVTQKNGVETIPMKTPSKFFPEIGETIIWRLGVYDDIQ